MPPKKQATVAPSGNPMADAIYAWLTTGDGKPHTYNAGVRRNVISVDGEIDCEKLATFVAARLDA